jgi:outer membrane protein assembly factor BamB
MSALCGDASTRRLARRLHRRLVCLASNLILLSCTRDVAPVSVVSARTAPVSAWITEMPGGMDRPVETFPYVNDSLLVLVASNGGLVAKRRADGTTAWAANGRWRNTIDVVGTGGVVVAASDTVVAFDLRTGAARWRYWSGHSAADCRASASAGTLYVCSRDWRVIALDAATGTVKWTTQLRDSLAGVPRLIGTAVSGDTLYATVLQKYSEADGRTVGFVFGIAANNGRILFKLQDGNYTDFTGYVTAPTIENRLLFLSHLNENKLTAVDRFSGRVIWRVLGDAGWAGFTSPAVARSGTIYAASGDRRVYAIESSTGRVVWRSDVLNGSQFAAEACGAFVLSWAGLKTIVLDRNTGKQLAVLDEGLEPSLSFTTPPVSAGNELYVMSQREVRKYTC